MGIPVYLLPLITLLSTFFGGSDHPVIWTNKSMNASQTEGPILKILSDMINFKL